MCGIVGIYSPTANHNIVNPEILKSMSKAIEHRGPDASGLWINPENTVGLAHQRLSIIDLSDQANQPMPFANNRIWITFNGEIYNYKKLRAQLIGDGYEFKSHSDTEVILALYHQRGIEGFHEMNGMFAFGLWDCDTKKLFLVRDRVGIKPLYYTVINNSILFSSEIKALFQHPLVKPELNFDALSYYLTFKTTPAPLTLFKNINKLSPGTIVECDQNGDLQSRVYWNPIKDKATSISSDEAAETIRDLLSVAVKDRMVADVPVGAFLSGGLDSSAVVALMRKCHSGPLSTFSIGIQEFDDANELDYARKISNHFGTEHHELKISQKDLINYLPQLVSSQDEPLADPVAVPIYFMSDYVKKRGISVVLVGEGSDELFYGYSSRLEFVRRHQQYWQKLFNQPKWVLSAMASLLGPIRSAHPILNRFAKAISHARDRDALFWGSTAFSPIHNEKLFVNSHVNDWSVCQKYLNNLLQDNQRLYSHQDIGLQLSYTDLKLRLAELLLMRTDKMTMSVALEARVPFLDYRLVEYLFSLPTETKLATLTEKPLLKQALQDLVPQEIINRRKQPFSAPVNRWLHCGLMESAREIIMDSKLSKLSLFDYSYIGTLLKDHETKKRDNGVKIWTLINLSAWYDHWIAP